MLTTEQLCLRNCFMDYLYAPLGGENPQNIILSPAPAGTGKTFTVMQTLLAIQNEDKRLNLPPKKMIMFYFDSGMKNLASQQALAMGIKNTEFYTFHSFLLQQALKNPLISPYFTSKKENILLIDFEKNGYSQNDIFHTVNNIFEKNGKIKRLDISNSSDKAFLSFYKRFTEIWTSSSLDEKEVSDLLSTMMFDEDFNINTIKDKSFKRLVIQEFESEFKNPFKSFFEDRSTVEILLQEVSELSSNEYEAKDLEYKKTLFSAINQNILARLLTPTSKNKSPHMGYAKKVQLIIKRKNINVLNDYNGIIVDEFQDSDSNVKEMVLAFANAYEALNHYRPTLLIGDRSQDIYGWRGSGGFFDELMDEHETKEELIGRVQILPLTSSFRFKNDIAQLSNCIIEETTLGQSCIVGKATSTISSIEEDIVDKNTFAKVVREFVSTQLETIRYYSSLSIDKMPKKELQKKLNKHKIAFISRNNASIVSAVVEVVPLLRELEVLKLDTKKVRKKEVEYSYDLRDYMNFGLTDRVADEIKTINKGIFDKKTMKQIEKEIPKYKSIIKGKNLKEILETKENRLGSIVSMCLKDVSKYKFLLTPTGRNDFDFLTKDLADRSGRSIKGNQKNSNIIFTTSFAAKGNAYNKVFLSYDFGLKENNNGRIVPNSKEEGSVFYVAVSRVEDRLYFYGDDKNENNCQKYYLDNKETIKKHISKEINYSYPFNTNLSIIPARIPARRKNNNRNNSNREELFTYTLTQNNHFIGMFLIPHEIIPKIGYLNSMPMVLKYDSLHDEDEGMFTFISSDGEKIDYEDLDENEYYFSFGYPLFDENFGQRLLPYPPQVENNIFSVPKSDDNPLHEHNQNEFTTEEIIIEIEEEEEIEEEVEAPMLLNQYR